MNLVIANRQRTKKINPRRLRQIMTALFAELEVTEVELGIALVNAREMARVNWQFLQHEGSTDVITFDHSDPAHGSELNGPRLSQPQRAARPIREEKSKPPSAHGVSSATTTTTTPRQIHGELFICVDDAIAQAKQFGSTWQSEVVRYAVHGVLHLLGHDDLQPDLRRKMKREENRLVRQLTARFSLAQLARPVKMGV